MNAAALMILITCAYPLGQAFHCNRRTSLSHAMAWVMAAWAGWIGNSAFACVHPNEPIPSYIALVMTGCAAMAVLGARRPGVLAWNFVVIALLAISMLPIAEGRGELQLSPIRTTFLAVTLAVVPFNYFPTRMGIAALALAIGCAMELIALAAGTETNFSWVQGFGRILIAISPWMAWGLLIWKRSPFSEFDRLWLDFRDRYGLTWSLRMREQFNRAAINAGWQVWLGWSGLRGPAGEMNGSEPLQTLRALLKRFGLEGPSPEGIAKDQ